MFLKSLTLKGFKSFADTTTLEFEPGITVVVGPNGSGKSNIVDAVAWVLGAQGPRTVRSSKMEDVIFAGSGKRPALGRAEVSLTIDNSAGLLPIEFTEVTITRTLFRSSGESEYSINGVPCRLLDVQELLSDSGVGRQQHVIVSQGQLDAVLNARPEDRRTIIEEAAGVLKYRRRREKAQRRLESTEGNLMRLQDLLREVRRQLRPLERQADAARRHDGLQSELRALKLHLAGREIASLQARLQGGASRKQQYDTDDRSLREALARLDTDVLAAEAALSATQGADLADTLVRFESATQRARAAAAVLTERRRSVERQMQASVDETVVASLEAEAARIAAALDEVELEAAVLVPQADELAEAEAALAAERVAFETSWNEPGSNAATGAAAEARGERGALAASVERGRAELARLDARLDALAQRTETIAAEEARLAAERVEADTAEEPLAVAARAAAAAVEAATAEVEAAEARRREAAEDRRTWEARAEALSLALDEARARAGAQRLSGIDGVLGTLLDVVEIDEGWEAAFEAAVGEAIAAVVVDGVESARAALDHLHETGTTGSVLPLAASAPPGSLGLDAAAAGGEPVREHVRSRLPSVDRLLDAVLSTAIAVDGSWAEALDLALAHPEIVAVTKAGDRFSAAGWRAGTGGTGATGAALDAARAEAEAAALREADLRATLAVTREKLAAATEANRDAAAALDANDARLASATDAQQRVVGDRREVDTELHALQARRADLADRLEREEARAAELDATLPALEAEEAAGAERVLAMRTARQRLDERIAAVTALRRDLEVRAAGLEERRALLTRRQAEVEDRLGGLVTQRADASGRRHELEAVATATTRLSAMVAARLTWLDEQVADLRAARQRHSAAVRATAERLDHLRRERAVAERQLSEIRERRQRVDIDETEVKVRLEAAVESVRRDLDCEPEAAMAAPCPELPPATNAPARARELERELRLMGPINPLALEEFDALNERHAFLEGQLEDVKNSRRELGKVIRAIDAEIVDLFSAAYADVADNFEKLFSTLFPGGTGRLRLTEPDHMLDTGIEVEARPSGKNVRKLSLLSGGERSLTALAFLFAVFRSRPSPFYLMDEVEAALDDVNLHRFLDLIHEFRQEAQLLVVSHQKRTMEAGDCLYGVTMQPGGSSRVVSERVAATN